MKIFWLIPFFLLQDTEAFLIKNAKFNLCLQASPTNRNLLLENCNPESDFQDWFWQGDSLVNHGTQSCLSVSGADRVQTSLCASTGYTSWDCSNSLLSPLGTSQSYLVANRKGVALGDVRGLKAQWQDAADRSVCEEKTAKAGHNRYFPAALTSPQVHEHTAGNAALLLGMDQEQLEELLWFFRREDPSTWNYSVLALSLAAFILGLVLLTINIVRNRKRKIFMSRNTEQTPLQAELDAKKALIPVQEYSPAQPQKQEPVPQNQRPGEVVVQWKDGTLTSLYTGLPEEAI
ncbi:organic solute transporter subunit beta [Pipra filicauda]|uniref:Organic solute transporter subunit beta n=1 Tax=Pipra filicauda TaxID=649802 RepID=A0A6J2G5A4_9PASS|nr:organic solute transporter subunit beta [Pipra filicauda]XP_039245062.1 organic solute transporter subunit beta [Pipra filicauda]